MASASSPSLALIHPTEEQFEYQISLNGEVWRGPLTMEAYLRRERYLAKRGLADGSGLTSWMLVDEHEPPENRQVLVGCETLRKRAFMVKAGEVSEVAAFGVASVFCPPVSRGKGYASKMMDLLCQAVQKEMPAKQQFSVLYSDIGKTFYARGGWNPYPSAHLHLPHLQQEAGIASAVDVKPLYEKDLQALCADDETLVRQRLSRQRGTAVALVPDHPTIVWHQAREDFVANELHGRTPEVKGAMARVGDHRVWAIWTRVWHDPDPKGRKDNIMYILRLVVEGVEPDGAGASDAHVEAISAVFRMAQHEADEWYMQEVELWNPQPWSLAAAQRLDPAAKIIDRDSESITSFKWLGEGSGDDVVWMENEKFGWC